MPLWSRRQLLQTGAAASLTAILPRFPRLVADAAPRERLLLDFGWRFHLGHANDLTQDFGFGHGGNQDSEYGKSGELFRPSDGKFDDSSWAAVDLPHDWAVELPYVQADELNDFGDHPLGRNYPATSIGWYRRAFTLPPGDAAARISLEFDGIFRDATIALNGHLVGRNFSGYAPYRADISDIVSRTGRNVLVVRVDATEHEGWFYEGAGIYRHAWLVRTAPVHVAHWGTRVTSTVTDHDATVAITTEVENQQDVAARCRIVQSLEDSTGRTVATNTSAPLVVAPWSTRSVAQQLHVGSPQRWSIETPTMYRMVTAIEYGGAVVDRYETPFGIRTLRWDPNQGFFLNDRHVELKGTCNHQDHAGVGSALPDRLQEYRIAKLKEMGSNAYRT
jgi:beta-galactosidase